MVHPLCHISSNSGTELAIQQLFRTYLMNPNHANHCPEVFIATTRGQYKNTRSALPGSCFGFMCLFPGRVISRLSKKNHASLIRERPLCPFLPLAVLFQPIFGG